MNYTCPRRIADGMAADDSPFVTAGPNKDTWDADRPGMRWLERQRLCSYDGSGSPEDLLAGIKSKTIEVGPTDKPYKFYITNIAAGAEGKFYTHHFSEDQGWEFHHLWKSGAVRWGYPFRPYVNLYIPGPSGANPQDPRWENT